MKKTLMIGLSALALGMAGTAYAHNHGNGMKGDADGNGVITRAEAQAGADAAFAKMDANSDGALTPADREARMTEQRTKMFAALDANSNGQISRDEFMAFKHDGKHDGMRGERGDRGDKRHHMGMRGPGSNQMMQRADTNKDGSISKAEFTTAAMSRFTMSDTNKDGQVTGEERKAAREQMRQKWREMNQDKAES